MASQLEYALNGLIGIGDGANWGDIAGDIVKRAVDAVAAECGEVPNYTLAGSAQYVERAGVLILIFEDFVWRVRLDGGTGESAYFGRRAVWRALPQLAE